ncbi:tail assembly chaperone [Bacillus phage 031MP002]|nr:tail assembly chaperone [Bacillus phage 031MP003]QFG05515.1 tail assembly chaperone [Bacillus phage 031MP002]
MTRTVQLKIKTTEGDQKLTKTVSHDIEKITLAQFTGVFFHVKRILNSLQKDGSVAELIETTFGADGDELSLQAENLTQAEIEEKLKAADNKFIVKIIESFETIAIQLPEEAIGLISTLSGIDKDVLKEQELTKFFEVFEAVLEVNDIEELVATIKKVFGGGNKSVQVSESRTPSTPIKAKTKAYEGTIADILIFQLSPILGGRSEVLDAPFVELLSHFQMLKERQENERYLNFLSMHYSNPMSDNKGRKEFLKSITPESQAFKTEAAKGKATVTDLNLLRQLKQQQMQEKSINKGG